MNEIEIEIEIWKISPEYPIYSVSNYGNVKKNNDLILKIIEAIKIKISNIEREIKKDTSIKKKGDKDNLLEKEYFNSSTFSTLLSSSDFIPVNLYLWSFHF